MAAKRWLNIAGVLLLIIVVGTIGVFVWVQPSFSICRRAAEIDTPTRTAITQAGLSFVRLLREGESTAAYDAMTEAGRAATERMEMIGAIEQIQAEAAGEPEVRDVYSLFTVGGQRGATPCATGGAHPAFVARGGGANTAFVLIAEPQQGGERMASLWLVRQDGRWMVHGFHIGRSAIAGRNGADFWRLADEQRVRGHTFNATLLYEFARMTLYRGDWFQSGEAYGFNRAYERLQRHGDLSRSAPHRFVLGGETFTIGYLQAIGTGDGSLVLMLEQRAETPEAVPDAVVRNRALIDAMNRYRPEWRQGFDALVSAYPTGGTRVYRTAYDAEQGYVADNAPPAPQD